MHFIDFIDFIHFDFIEFTEQYKLLVSYVCY